MQDNVSYSKKGALRGLHYQLYVPPGFAHGFYVLSEDVCFHYKCTDYYQPGDEYGVAWNDESLGIKWPLEDQPLLSLKDKLYVALHDTHIDNLPKI